MVDSLRGEDARRSAPNAVTFGLVGSGWKLIQEQYEREKSKSAK